MDQANILAKSMFQICNLSITIKSLWRCGVVIISTAQFH